MSENNKENIQNQAQNAAAAVNVEQPEKMFTQEEVNKIVSDRLMRDREARAAQQVENKKEQELNARAAELDCRAFLIQEKLPEELLEIIDTSDVEKFKATASKLNAIYGLEARKARFSNPPKFSSPLLGHSSSPDPVREAFKPKTQ